MNGVLLDTHIWLWVLFDDPRLTRGLRRAISADADRSWLSPISICRSPVRLSDCSDFSSRPFLTSKVAVPLASLLVSFASLILNGRPSPGSVGGE